ncbi:MAG: radical SAM protein [Chloroflexi bacterium]|nr:radical SAM protein [Chloroflexota bacterium]
MKIALVYPPVSPEDLAGKTASMKAVINVVQPLGIAYIAAVLEREGYEVKLYDCSLGTSAPELLDLLRREQPEVVGISSTTPAFPTSKAVATRLKEVLPKTVILIGGPHVTAAPVQTMASHCFDVGVIGEGEITALELVQQMEKGGLSDLATIKGIAYRENGRVTLTPPRPFITDLDSLPFPARHLLPPLSQYKPTPASYRKLPVGVVMTSRGCPSGCTFCDRAIFGRRWRARSADNVLGEIELLVEKLGAREIRFFDDTFTLNQKRAFEICDRLIKGKFKIPWTCLTRVDAVSIELLRHMKEAGCWQVLFGLESGDDRMLKLLNKGSTVEKNERAVRLAQEVGLSVRGDFIIGTPGETRESMQRTLNFTKSLKLDYAHFNKFVPFPGTALYERLVGEGYDFDVNEMPSILDHSAILYVPEGMTKEEFQTFLDQANREFYLRPSHILRRLVRTRSWDELMGQIRGFFAIWRL